METDKREKEQGRRRLCKQWRKMTTKRVWKSKLVKTIRLKECQIRNKKNTRRTYKKVHLALTPFFFFKLTQNFSKQKKQNFKLLKLSNFFKLLCRR